MRCVMVTWPQGNDQVMSRWSSHGFHQTRVRWNVRFILCPAPSIGIHRSSRSSVEWLLELHHHLRSCVHHRIHRFHRRILHCHHRIHLRIHHLMMGRRTKRMELEQELRSWRMVVPKELRTIEMVEMEHRMIETGQLVLRS